MMSFFSNAENQPTSPLRLLLWLKWTLLWRGYRTSRIKAVGAIIMLLVFLPVSLGAAWAVWKFSTLFPEMAPIVARDTLSIIYILWVLTPLLGFQLNESFDLTRLFTYPLTYRQIFFGSVLGSVLDMPVLLTLPTFAVLLALFCASPAAWIVSVLLLILFLFHTLALGQAITIALIGFLRSRRFRDITIVLFPLLGMSYYVAQRVFFSQMREFHFEQLLDSPLWRILNFLPPGWTASALNGAANGDWVDALLGLGAMALAAMAALWAAAQIIQSLYLGDKGPLVARTASMPQEPPVPVVAAVAPVATLPLGHFLPPTAQAIASKEWTYLQREPQYKALAVNMLYTLAAIALPLLLPMAGRGTGFGGLGAAGEWRLYVLTGTLLLSGLPLLFNIFGGEGAAVTTLFSFPARRRDILIGKNVTHGILMVLLCTIGLTGIAAAIDQWQALPRALMLAVLSIPVMLATGNLVSVRLPHRLLVRGQRWTRGGVASSGGAGGEGCTYAFLYLLAYGAAFALLIPAVCATLLPGRFGISPFWFVLTLPLAAVYAGTLYVLLLGQAEIWLLAREPEIMARIVPEL